MTLAQRQIGYTADTCKTDGCDQPPEDRQGRYAGFCAEHKLAERGRRAEERANGEPAKPTGLADVAKQLVPRSRALETALQRKTDATRDAKTALAKFNDALNELRDAAESLVNPNKPR